MEVTEPSSAEMYSVRTATAADATAISDVEYRAFDRKESHFTTAGTPSVSELDLRVGEWLVAVDVDGRVCGAVEHHCFGERDRKFRSLAVRPELEGEGIGRALVSAVEQICRERGGDSVYLTIATPRLDLPPKYARLGYSRTGRTQPARDPDALIQYALEEWSKRVADSRAATPSWLGKSEAQ